MNIITEIENLMLKKADEWRISDGRFYIRVLRRDSGRRRMLDHILLADSKEKPETSQICSVSESG